MAYLADVENALALICSEALVTGPYRFGGVVPSVVGPSVRIYRGWPTASALNTDLAAGTANVPGSQIVNVSIFGQPGHTRITDRFLDVWRATPRADPTLVVTASSQTLTLTGVPSPSQVVGIALGKGFGRETYSYRPTATDSLDSIAVSLAALIPGATSDHATIHLPEVPFEYMVAADQQIYRELRRQTQGLMVTVWAPSSQTRDLVAARLDAVFADVRCLALPDFSGTSPIGYSGVIVTDVTEKDSLYRVDLLINVNYATTITEIVPVVLFPRAIVDS